MKQFLIPAIALVSALCAHAEGYQVNSFSARQEGMGHTGVGMTLGAESTIFNPGAVAFSDKTFDISASMTAIVPYASATVDGVKYETDNKISTPFNVSTAFRIYDNLYGGIALYTPYGSSINWGDNWPGAVLNQSVDIKLFSLQPTLSYRLLPNLSIGAGLTINWGSVDLNKGLVSDGSLNTLMTALGMPASSLFDGVTPASVNLKGNTRIALGFNVGALWKIDRRWKVGASFRSRLGMKVTKGQATVSYANETARAILGQTLDNLNSTNFAASLPCPYVFTVGASYEPINGLIIAADVQLNGWKTYRELNISFDHLEAFNQHLTKNYHNALTYHVGAQYALTRRFDVRAGLMVDCSPCDREFYNPETPAQTRIEPSVGFSFRPISSISIDFAFMYVHGCGIDNASGQYDDFIAKSYPQLGLPNPGTFTADYRLHAFMPSLGISYKF